MPTYIALYNWTRKGLENVRESPNRLDHVKKMVREAGGEIQSVYMTMGPYDLVFIFEMPDDESYARLALSVAALGNVSAVTLKAFNEGEYRNIINSLP